MWSKSLDQSRGSTMAEVIFYYDVICPYAYLASRLISNVAKATGAKIKWRPVLLGGIYKATKSADELTKKPFDAMNPAKRAILTRDLMRLYQRHNVPALPFRSIPDLSTLGAMRLIAACDEETSDLRKNLTHELYKNLWAEKKDVSKIGILEAAVKKLGWDVDVKAIVSGENSIGKETLFENTQEAVERGAFGVPSYWVNNRLYYGEDRLHFVERELGNGFAIPFRLKGQDPKPSAKKLKIFHDFASPWCYVGFRRIEELAHGLHPINIEVEWVPILLGAVFQAIGSPQVPLFTAGENKRKYGIQDFHDWCHMLSIDDLQFPSAFPHASLTALRVSIVNTDDKLRAAIYNAAWTKDADIGDLEVLSDIITKSGFNAQELLASTQSQAVKDKLRENTTRALSLGICGVPSYQVDDQPLIWGQDRLNIIADELCGWQDNVEEVIQSITNSKL